MTTQDEPAVVVGRPTVNRPNRLDHLTAEIAALRRRVDNLERRGRDTRPAPAEEPTEEEDYLYTGVD